MKLLSSALLAAVAFAAPAFATTITTPANGSQVTSPFNLVASSATCGGVPTVSMGYEIDSLATTTLPGTSLSASVAASPGAHVLKVKCWGKGTSGVSKVNITVLSSPLTDPGTPNPNAGSDITVTSPANGASVTAPFTLAASTTHCAGAPALSMGYSIDGGAIVKEPAAFSAAVSKSLGTHTIALKCYGQNTQDQTSLTVKVVPPPTAATPQFSVPSGSYTTQQIVTLADATPGATIYYTTDGSGPTTSSPVYSGPITVSNSMVIEAMAGGPGFTNSGLGRASYTIKPASHATIPSNAIQVKQIQTFPRWRTKFDPATSGTASGLKSMVNDPSLSGQAARFDTQYTYYGGVLYSVSYDHDSAAKNFVYDANVWIQDGSVIGNLEMDNNQVMANGHTMIYAFQCAGTGGVWEFGSNGGTIASPKAKWVKSNVPCNPGNWAKNTWHHVQISYSRDDAGNVTYHSVWLDQVEYPINATVLGEFSLGWAKGVLVANFQVDGLAGSGSSTLYLDNLTISRW